MNVDYWADKNWIVFGLDNLRRISEGQFCF